VTECRHGPGTSAIVKGKLSNTSTHRHFTCNRHNRALHLRSPSSRLRVCVCVCVLLSFFSFYLAGNPNITDFADDVAQWGVLYKPPLKKRTADLQ